MADPGKVHWVRLHPLLQYKNGNKITKFLVALLTILCFQTRKQLLFQKPGSGPGSPMKTMHFLHVAYKTLSIYNSQGVETHRIDWQKKNLYPCRFLLKKRRKTLKLHTFSCQNGMRRSFHSLVPYRETLKHLPHPAPGPAQLMVGFLLDWLICTS